MLYSIHYIYYMVLKIQICFNKAEPTLEFNHSIFLIIAGLSFKSPHCHSNSWIAKKVVTQQGRNYKIYVNII